MRPTLLLVIVSCALSSPAMAQDWVPQGGITSRQYEKQIREGGQVTATDFFTLEYSVSTWIEELGDGGGPTMVCTNKCRGNVHKGHATCDYSCDDRCTENHRLRVKGEYFPDRSAMDAATAAANGLAVRGGGTASPSDWSHRVSSALAEFRREANKRKTFDMEHALACSGKSQKVDVRTYAFHVRGTMKKVGYRMSRGVRTPIDETVGMHESVVATAKIVKDMPKDKKTWTACLCKAPQEPEIDIDAMLDNLIKLLEDLMEQERLSHLCGTAAVSMRDKAGQHVDPGESKIVVKPADMNRCEVQIENGTGTDVEVTIPVGTVFQSQDKSFQDMASVVTTRGMLYAGQTKSFYVSTRPELVQTTALFPVRWACLNMAKKEPSPSARYTMRSPQDDILIRLGAITDQARVRGPHDQARMWIYTDKAPMDEINKRMLPGVSEGRYTSLLHDVAKSGVDLSGTEYRRCLEPKLLTGIALDDQAAAALVSVLAETKPADLARYVNSNAAMIARLVDTDPQYGPGHVATVATALLTEDNADVRKCGLKLVTSVRAENRAAFAGAGGLAGVRNMLTSPSEAGAAVDALIAYPLELAGEMLGASWEQLPSDAMKAKVKNHLGIE